MEDFKDLLPENFDQIALEEFRKYDYNHNGIIEKKELILLYRGLAESFGMNKNDVDHDHNLQKSLMEEIDMDNDKKITFEEFKKFFARVYLLKN